MLDKGWKHYIVVSVWSLLLVYLSFIVVMPAYAGQHPKSRPAPPKTSLMLNIQQGPLGASLSLTGKGFHAGHAGISYIDATNTTGVLMTTNDSGVQVQKNGTFTTTAYLPNQGPAGSWQIVVTDSAHASASARYTVLTAPGSTIAGVPTLTTNPTSGKPGDVIAFTGTNWLPAGTTVKLSLLLTTTPTPLAATPVVSDKNGTITGAFHLPEQIGSMPSQSLIAIAASDSHEALHAQARLLLLPLVAVPTIRPKPVSTPQSAASTLLDGSQIRLNGPTLFLLILIVGSVLAVAAFTLILFLMPWGRRERYTFYNDKTTAMRVSSSRLLKDDAKRDRSGSGHF